MQHKKIKLSALLLMGVGILSLQAQQTIPATGGNAAGSGGSLSYSVGQVFYTGVVGFSLLGWQSFHLYMFLKVFDCQMPACRQTGNTPYSSSVGVILFSSWLFDMVKIMILYD